MSNNRHTFLAAAAATIAIAAVLLSSAFSASMIMPRAFAQDPFDITTTQSAADQQALITVKLATNNTLVIPTNGSIIEVPGNVTVIDNDTVIITPDNETVTEAPGNVTVITPSEPVPCECPPAAAEPEPAGPLDPVRVTPAPGQEVITENGTQLIANESQQQEEPIPLPPPAAPDEGNVTTTTEPPITDLPPVPAEEEGGGEGGNFTEGGNASEPTGEPALEPAGLTNNFLGFLPDFFKQ